MLLCTRAAVVIFVKVENMIVLKDENDEKVETDEINQSEKKRLKSLKCKKEVFKAKELAVQNALKNLDRKLNNNKIIFDDDFEGVEEPELKVKQKEKKRKRDLFDDDNDSCGNDELLWDDNKFQSEKNSTAKFPRSNIILGNDERFKLDKRFTDDNQELNVNVNTESNDETNLRKEKELELDILENILGAPIASKRKETNNDLKSTKKGMIRYDPTESNHKEYEIAADKSCDTKEIKKKKRKDSTREATENAPVQVSKDIFFSVSDSLSKSLKEEGQFSLLKTYATTKTENDEKEDDTTIVSNAETLQTQKFQFNFMSKNPFKYDSSDDERDDKDVNTDIKKDTNYSASDTNKFFFDINDVRFIEAQNFFCANSAPEGTFQELRRELKQIVRCKIRRNVKKKQPWGYKKKIKRS